MESIGKLVKIAYYSLNNDLQELARPYGITAVQMTILDFIRSSNTPITQHDIEKEFHVKSSTIAVLVDRMEAKKLVARYKSKQDKRKNEIKLTESGLSVSNAIKDSILENDQAILSVYSMREQETIFRFLEDLGNIESRLYGEKNSETRKS